MSGYKIKFNGIDAAGNNAVQFSVTNITFVINPSSNVQLIGRRKQDGQY